MVIEWAYKTLPEQAEQLVDLLAEPLGFIKEKYRSHLDRLVEGAIQPPEYAGRFDIPVLVQPPRGVLTLHKMLETLQIVAINFPAEQIEDWSGGDFVTPLVPYITWMQNGQRYLNTNALTMRSKLALDERAGTYYDGLSLCLAVAEPKGKYLLTHVFDTPGSQLPNDQAAFLRWWHSSIMTREHKIDSTHPDMGPITAGRKIYILEDEM